MKALKLGLVVSLVALFFIACSTETTNNNASPAANRNSPSAGTVAPPAAAGSPTANVNSPGGPASATGNPPAPATNANAASAAKPAANVDAAALFAANKCAGCHGADGKGNPNMKDVPNFTDAAWQKKESDAELIKTIKNGHKPMPAYKDKLSDQEIQALVAYVRSFAK